MPFDRMYIVEPSQFLTEDTTFYGYQNSKIVQDLENYNWKIEMLDDNNTYAFTNMTFPDDSYDLPLGTREYYLSESRY